MQDNKLSLPCPFEIDSYFRLESGLNINSPLLKSSYILPVLILIISIVGCSDYAKQLTLDGDKKMQVADYENAIIDYTEALKVKPDAYQSLHNRGYCYLKTGNLAAAIQDLDASIASKPDFATAYMNRAVAKSQTLNFKPALVDLMKADSLGYDDPALALLKGNCLFELGVFEQAIGAFNIALNNFSDSLKINLARGISYYQTGSFSNAIEDLNKYLAFYPESSIAMKYIGRSAYRLKRYSDAIESYEKLVLIQPQLSAKDHKYQIDCYLQRGKESAKLEAFSDAMQDFTKIITMDPLNADAFYNRGVIQLKFGHDFEGCEDISTAFENGHADAQKILEKSCADFVF